MAHVFSTKAYNMDDYDFSWLERHSKPTFHTNSPVTVHGITYKHWFAGVFTDGSGSFIGTANDEQTMRGLFHSTTHDTSGIWAGMEGISLDIDAVDRAMNTASTSDDFGLIAAELSGADRFDLSFKGDLARGYGGSDTMNGNGGADRLYGGDGDDKLNGGAGGDRLYGEAGRDKLYGGAGKDLLDGGEDSDRDTFVFDDSDSALGTQRDMILHFVEATDLIDLSRIDSNAATSRDDAFHWSDQTAAGHSIWWTATADGVIVSGDVTGDTKADFEILLAGATSLTTADILL